MHADVLSALNFEQAHGALSKSSTLLLFFFNIIIISIPGNALCGILIAFTGGFLP